MTDISITTANGKTTVNSPYHPAFPTQAKAIGGKFAAGLWTFDARDEQRARDLCQTIYGTDGTPTKLVTVRVKYSDIYRADTAGNYANLFHFGRKIASRGGRDMPVRLGDGVIMLEGSFPGRGGSVKNPSLDGDDDIVFEIRDVPAGHPQLTGERTFPIEVIDEGGVDLDALHAERDKLTARLAEIHALLGVQQ